MVRPRLKTKAHWYHWLFLKNKPSKSLFFLDLFTEIKYKFISLFRVRIIQIVPYVEKSRSKASYSVVSVEQTGSFRTWTLSRGCALFEVVRSSFRNMCKAMRLTIGRSVIVVFSWFIIIYKSSEVYIWLRVPIWKILWRVLLFHSVPLSILTIDGFDCRKYTENLRTIVVVVC